MINSPTKITDLWKFAIPIESLQNIGQIDYLGYKTLIVINDFERKQGNETI
jgi:hypothetical protein